MSLFEVWRDGRCLMTTESSKCIYPADVIENMRKNGCTIKYKGKKISKGKYPWIEEKAEEQVIFDNGKTKKSAVR